VFFLSDLGPAIVIAGFPPEGSGEYSPVDGMFPNGNGFPKVSHLRRAFLAQVLPLLVKVKDFVSIEEKNLSFSVSSSRWASDDEKG